MCQSGEKSLDFEELSANLLEDLAKFVGACILILMMTSYFCLSHHNIIFTLLRIRILGAISFDIK